MTKREFEIQFRRLYLPLGMYALRIVDDADDAEDIVEETFLKVWETLDRGLKVDSFGSFMYRAVRNNCISFLRHRLNSACADEIPEVSDETIDTSERDARIWSAIDNLPE